MVSISLGNGDGTFAPPDGPPGDPSDSPVETFQTPGGTLLAAQNLTGAQAGASGNPLTDLVVTNNGQSWVYLADPTGDGGFANTATPITVPMETVAAADLTGSGQDELLGFAGDEVEVVTISADGSSYSTSFFPAPAGMSIRDIVPGHLGGVGDPDSGPGDLRRADLVVQGYVGNTDETAVLLNETPVAGTTPRYQTQVIAFGPTPTDAAVGGTPLTLSATGGGSGNPVVYSVDQSSQGVCSVVGDSVSFQAVGTCTIDANQAGSETYAEATQAQLSFPVGSGVLGITSAPATTLTVGQAGTFTVTTTPGSAGSSPGTISLTESGALPTGVTFTDNGNGTATLGGTPGAGTSGTYSLTIGATDGVDPGARQTFTLDVDRAAAFTSADTATFIVGQPGQFEVTTSGFPTASVGASGGTLPAGLTFTENGDGTATLSGTPAAGTEGAYTFTLTASNGVGQVASQSTTLDVDQPPSITSGATTGFTVGVPGHFTVKSGGFPAAALSETGTLPTGVTFTDNGDGTATLSGTPAAGTGGSYAFTITASNSVTPAATQAFVLDVDEPPSITSAGTTRFTVGQPGTFTVTTSPGTVDGPPGTVSLAERGTLPGGVTFLDDGDGTATLSGTPEAGTSGFFPFTITASNGVLSGASQTFTLEVDGAPAITSADTATFTTGQSGSFSVTTSGFPAAALSESGALPTGVSFTDNGNGTATVAGTPDVGSGGVFPFTITASNGVGVDASQGFSLDVSQAPSVTSADTATFTTGESGSFSVTTSGFPAAALSDSGDLPTGVTFTDNGNGTATLAGTPAEGTGGFFNLTITASNGVAPDSTQAFTLDVDAPPTITSAGSTTFTVGQSGKFSVTTSPGTRGGLPGTVALSETGTLPTGVTFTDNGNGTASLAGTPTAGAAGSYGLAVTATNGVAPGVTQNVTLTVQDVPGAPQDVTASSGVDSAVVSWEPPATDGLSSISGYTVTADPGGESAVVGATATETTLNGLTPGVDYTFTVSATNGVGTGLASNASNTIEAVSVAEQDVSPGSSASPTGTATTPTIGLGPSTTLSAQAIGAGTLDIGSYPSDPVPSLPGATAFFDVAVAPGSTFGDVTFQACGITVNTSLEWWNPDAQGWVPVSAQSTPDGSPVCATGTATATTSPSVSQLGGTVFALVSFSVPPGSVTVSGPATVDSGSTYAASAAAPGAVPAPTYALAAGAPSWLAIDPSSGAVSGTVPGGITSFSYGVTAANSAGSATSAQQSVIVDSAPGPVSVSGPSSVTVGTAYAAVATSSGAAPGPTYALAAGAPPWLAINPLTGAIGGAVPEGLASFSYVVTATNTVASSVSSAQTVTVTPGSTSLALSPSPAPSVGVGSAVTYTATVTETAGSGPLSGTVSFTENGGAVAGCSSLALSAGSPPAPSPLRLQAPTRWRRHTAPTRTSRVRPRRCPSRSPGQAPNPSSRRPRRPRPWPGRRSASR